MTNKNPIVSRQVQHFAYDSCPNGLGRLCTVSDGTGTTAYSYTPEGWVSGRGFTIGSTSYALTYSYDAQGRVTAVLYPDDNEAAYSYTDGVVSGVVGTTGGNYGANVVDLMSCFSH